MPNKWASCIKASTYDPFGDEPSESLREVREHRQDSPYGWSVVKGKLVVNHSEQTVVRRIKKMRKSGKSLSEIARTLNLEGISSKNDSKWLHCTVKEVI